MENFACFFHAAAYRRQHPLALLLTIFILGTVTHVHGQTKQQKDLPQHATSPPAANRSIPQLSYEIIPASQNTYGYNILSGNKKLVHQPNIPGLPGNKGFLTKSDAEKCAKLVINKINNNIMPPTVTRQELDSLHIKL